MAKGVQVETVRYILKEDKGLPKSEQTIWHIRLNTILNNVKSLERMSKAFTTDARGATEMHGVKYGKALRQNFNDSIVKVENYMFGYMYPELQEKGYIDVDGDDIDKIFDESPRDRIDELLDIASQATEEETLERKK